MQWRHHASGISERHGFRNLCSEWRIEQIERERKRDRERGVGVEWTDSCCELLPSTKIQWEAKSKIPWKQRRWKRSRGDHRFVRTVKSQSRTRTVDSHAYVRQPQVLFHIADRYKQTKRHARDVMACERKWMVDHKLLHPSWHQLSIIFLLHKKLFLSQVCIACPRQLGAPPPQHWWSGLFPKLSVSSLPHSPHTPHITSTHMKQICLRLPLLANWQHEWGSRYHQPNRQERFFADVGVLAEIGDGDLEKCQRSLVSQGTK